MQHTRPRSQVFSIAAAVLALHATLCWLLLSGARGVRMPRGSQSLEIVLLAPAAPTPSRRSLPERAGRSPSKSTAASPSAPAAPEPEPDGAIHPRIDWDAELARAAAAAADAAAAGAARPKPRDFGFPAAEAPPAKRPQFGWDYAATHRIQPIDGGGLLVNLNDNCVMVFLPLPFVFCKPGHKPANGELFRHMSPLAGEGSGPE
jgi:hypothetical protein